jgi:hypothetical protein
VLSARGDRPCELRSAAQTYPNQGMARRLASHLIGVLTMSLCQVALATAENRRVAHSLIHATRPPPPGQRYSWALMPSVIIETENWPAKRSARDGWRRTATQRMAVNLMPPAPRAIMATRGLYIGLGLHHNIHWLWANCAGGPNSDTYDVFELTFTIPDYNMRELGRCWSGGEVTYTVSFKIVQTHYCPIMMRRRSYDIM